MDRVIGSESFGSRITDALFFNNVGFYSVCLIFIDLYLLSIY